MVIFGDQRISYVAIELILKNYVNNTSKTLKECQDNVILGLFTGLRNDTYSGIFTLFILVHDVKKEARLALNSDIYNIISLDKCSTSGKRFFTFYSASEEDQKQAREHLTDVVKTLDKQGACIGNSNEIDISKYTDVPETLSSPLIKAITEKDTPSSSAAVGLKNHRFKNCSDVSGPSYNSSSGYVAAKPTPLFYRRKTEKPDLKQMKKWVKQVMSGEYEQPEIKEITIKSTETKSSNMADENADLRDMYTGYGGYDHWM